MDHTYRLIDREPVDRQQQWRPCAAYWEDEIRWQPFILCLIRGILANNRQNYSDSHQQYTSTATVECSISRKWAAAIDFLTNGTDKHVVIYRQKQRREQCTNDCSLTFRGDIYIHVCDHTEQLSNVGLHSIAAVALLLAIERIHFRICVYQAWK